MKTSIARFTADESGATAIEYGLIAAGIAVAHHGHDHAEGEACNHIVDARDIAGPLSWRKVLAVVVLSLIHI